MLPLLSPTQHHTSSIASLAACYNFEVENKLIDVIRDVQGLVQPVWVMGKGAGSLFNPYAAYLTIHPYIMILSSISVVISPFHYEKPPKKTSKGMGSFFKFKSKANAKAPVTEYQELETSEDELKHLKSE
ncbi:hypothetical protein BDQ17DRAFT_1336821 [Cyathus striatus]|nr:hypothetical protein BDQ17DRAFT_1336821 [Cyathus striatus]